MPVDAMPGVSRLSINALVKEAREAAALGIPAIALFPVTPPAKKDEQGSEAFNPDNVICRAIKAVKDAVPNIGIIVDVALDPYTSHGHDGVLENGVVANDATVELLCTQSRVLAEAGADILAPSDMMDGRIGAIRDALEHANHPNTMLLSYAAKYASSYYGPFREAVGSAGALKGDKRTYQMDPSNAREALAETALDIAEGADMVMVKPAMAYLDIIYSLHAAYDVPVFAYQVSGEYAALKAAAANGWLDYEAVMMESLLACKRAGASAIFTYAAMDVARLLQRD